ncbi:MAG TPA: MgtC/SapB family protein [Gemmataceae bacterium]|nr:MgtC/SapB family protein [Gemmataceae bacterium]
MGDMWAALRDDFSDLSDAGQFARVAGRLLLATILGGVLGYEREHRHKRAGLRTHMLVSVGAALFVLAPAQAKMSAEAVSRVLQGLVVGIGFLGAGTILHLHDRQDIKGLTTAANIWLTAAIGVCVGLGLGATAVLSTALALVILALLWRWEKSAARLTQGESGANPPRVTG